jgi:hypothetical protein
MNIPLRREGRKFFRNFLPIVTRDAGLIYGKIMAFCQTFLFARPRLFRQILLMGTGELLPARWGESWTMGTSRSERTTKGMLAMKFKRIFDAAVRLFSGALALSAGAIPCASVHAQSPCCDSVYRLEYQTVYEERQVTAYRLECETVYDERQVTSYRPVWETEVRQRRYTVAKPVYETSEREETYFVDQPVWDERIEDRSYDVVRNVFETQEREERYFVNRPVWETLEREVSRTVRRPVVETMERDECYTVMQPVTTLRAVQVDQGYFVEQQTYEPGRVRNRLKWQDGACVVDPLTGRTAYQRGGLFWTPVAGPGTVRVQRVYQPNIVTQQVPETTFQPQTVTRKVPVTVTRYVDEVIVERVPQQVCKMVHEEHVRRVPYTVCRPVRERVENKVPVKVCRIERQQMVRRVPVKTMRMVQEERVEDVPVRVCRQVAFEETVRVPRVVEKRVPMVYTYRVPRTMVYRVPLDPCGNPIVYDGPVAAPAESTFDSMPPARSGKEGKPTPAKPRSGKNESDDANERPSLDPDERPGPIDDEKTDGSTMRAAPRNFKVGNVKRDRET